MKYFLKQIIFIIFTLLVLPLVLFYFALGLIVNKDQLVMSNSQFLSLFPGLAGTYIRKAALRFMLTKCDWQSHISFGVLFSHRDTEIESGVYIGPQANIGKCRIGANTLLGSGVHIMSGKGQHNIQDLDTPIREQGGVFEKISIGEDCWVGNGAMIMANVGNKCVVGAGAVVTNNIPDYAIVAGNPAVIIRMRNSA